MENVIRFLDRNSEYREMHIISTRPLLDMDSEELTIEFSGIDDTVIISLSANQCAKLVKELTKAQESIKQTQSRKKRRLKEKGIITEELEGVLSAKDIDELYKGTMFAK